MEFEEFLALSDRVWQKNRRERGWLMKKIGVIPGVSILTAEQLEAVVGVSELVSLKIVLSFLEEMQGGQTPGPR